MRSLLLTMFRTLSRKQLWTDETSSSKHFLSLLPNNHKRMESCYHSQSILILWTQQTLNQYKAVRSNKSSTIHCLKFRNLTYNSSSQYKNDILSSKLIMTSLRQLYCQVLMSFQIISHNITRRNRECINLLHRDAFVILK